MQIPQQPAEEKLEGGLSRPGRCITNSSARGLQGGKVGQDCVEARLQRGLAGRQGRVGGVAREEARVGLGGLQAREGGVSDRELCVQEGHRGVGQQRIGDLCVYRLQRRQRRPPVSPAWRRRRRQQRPP